MIGSHSDKGCECLAFNPDLLLYIPVSARFHLKYENCYQQIKNPKKIDGDKNLNS